MPGLCGTIGGGPPHLADLVEGLRWHGGETTAASGDDPAVAVVDGDADQPATSRGGTARVWLWGDVYGHETPAGYAPLPDGDAARYCAELYRRYGPTFVARLNGTFAGAVDDPASGTLYLFTDRLGSHPVYATETGGGLAFSTHLQSLAAARGVGTDFRPARLVEYLTVGRVSGRRTPFVGIEELHPGSVLAVDRETGAYTSERYWTPTYRPRDEPYGHFVDRFTETLRTVVEEHTDSEDRYGLLLSGGSDSRLLLGAVGDDRSLTAYHMADWLSREARIAERTAVAADRPFVWLERSDDHHARALEANAPMMNFYGRFDEAHTTGFGDRLRAETDELLSGLYADTLFGGITHPTPTVSLGPIGTLELPVESSIDSPEEFLEWKAEPTPAFLEGTRSLEAVLRDGLRTTDDGIEYHGVRYDSLRDLVALSEFYPLSNDPDLFYYGLTRTHDHWTPFLDNRMVDLALSMPVEYKLRRNVVGDALERIDADLAAIPHAASGVALDRSAALQYVGEQVTSLWRRLPFGRQPPTSRCGHDPWTPLGNVLEHDAFGMKTLLDNQSLVEALPFLSWEGAIDCYRDQLEGADNHRELFMLLGFLEMPVTEALARDRDRARREPPVGPATGGGDRDRDRRVSYR